MTLPDFYRVETACWDLSRYNALLQTPLDKNGGRLHLTDAPRLGIEMNIEYLHENVIPAA